MNNHSIINIAVSIIVPVYGVEKYIEKCVVSLFEQDFDNIEYIFVNDCTPDNSIAILQELIEKYPKRKPHIKIIHHEQNKGLGAARKTGILNASGEYILHIDSDDWCELDMVSSMYYCATQNNATIVYCDFDLAFSGEEQHLQQITISKADDMIKAVLLGDLHGSLANKLIARCLYKKLRLIKDYNLSLYEDKLMLLEILLNLNPSDTVQHLNKAFYHYRQDNLASLSNKQFSDKSAQDVIKGIQFLSAVFDKMHALPQYQNELNATILYMKKIFACNRNYRKYWYQLCPEVNQVKYVLMYRGYGVLKKMITIMGMWINLDIILYAHKIRKS